MSKPFTYIIIDDSEIDIFIASKMIQTYSSDSRIVSFMNGPDALQMLINSENHQPDTIIFVDINMPIMDGFQFMEEFEKLPEEITKSFVPCFLTSSINESDIAMSKTFKTIRKYINKPLSHQIIRDIILSIQ